jgi:fibronectin type 3 domain-containing protein
MCGIEDMTLTNPNYHRAYDTFSTLNMDFALLVARASIATVAMLAQPFESPAPPATITVQSQLAGTLFMRAKTAYLTWSAPPGATAYNVYRTTTSRSGYQRLNRTPLTTTSFADRFLPATVTYYYVVASLDGGGNEGNYSKEAVLAGATIR